LRRKRDQGKSVEVRQHKQQRDEGSSPWVPIYMQSQ
jgi:hypothetical protein